MGKESHTGRTGKQLNARFSGPVLANFDRKSANTLVTLSIKGNVLCAEENLGAIVKAALSTRHCFNMTTFLIADGLYFNNLLPSDHPTAREIEQAHIEAAQKGDDYILAAITHILRAVAPSAYQSEEFQATFIRDFLRTNTTPDSQISALNALAQHHNLPIEFIRWNDWVAREALEDTISHVRSAFTEEGTPLHDALVEAAEQYARRKYAGTPTALWQYRSREYLTDEYATFAAFLLKGNTAFLAYPGKAPGLFDEFRRHFFISDEDARPGEYQIVETPTNQFSWIEITFRRKSPELRPVADEAPPPPPRPLGPTVIGLSVFPVAADARPGDTTTAQEEKQFVIPDPLTAHEQLLYAILHQIVGLLNLLAQSPDEVVPAAMAPLRSSLGLLSEYREQRPDTPAHDPATKTVRNHAQTFTTLSCLTPSSPKQTMAHGLLCQILAIQTLEISTASKLQRLEEAVNALVVFIESNIIQANGALEVKHGEEAPTAAAMAAHQHSPRVFQPHPPRGRGYHRHRQLSVFPVVPEQGDQPAHREDGKAPPHPHGEPVLPILPASHHAAQGKPAPAAATTLEVRSEARPFSA